MATETRGLTVGDFVEVVAGRGYAGPGTKTVKGRVVEIAPVQGGDAEVMVHVTSGGTWGFMASHLRVLPKKAAR